MSHRRVPSTRLALAAVAAAAVSAAAPAAAKAPAPVVKAARNAALGKTIVVNAKGMTLYRLAPETTKALKCTGICATYWPPLTVKSKSARLVAGKGVRGKLTVYRAEGQWRVALRGYPLYTYVADSAKGAASGDGLQSFGGTWKVVSAK